MSHLEQQSKGTGLVHLYVGDGKGKTTAAIGLSVRMLGAGKQVLFCQFLKGRPSGELLPLSKLGGQIQRAECCGKFVRQMTPEERRQMTESHSRCLSQAAEAARQGQYGLIVLDEVVDAVNCGAVTVDDLLELIRNRDEGVEIVLTGRDPAPAIVEIADYHTEFHCKKHPYQTGISARNGIEY